MAELLMAPVINNDLAQFINLIKSNEFQSVKTCLTTHPELALETDKQHGSALLIALKTSNDAIVELLLKTLNTSDQYKVTALLKEVNHNGCNVLHHVAKRDNYALYAELITLLGKETESLSQHINYHYNLPLNLNRQQLSINNNAERKKIHDDLLEQTLDKQVLPLTQPITFAEIIKACNLDKNTPELLLNNVSAGCIAASHVRHMLNASSTHPSCNQLDEQEFDRIIQRLYDLRSKTASVSYLPSCLDRLEGYENIIEQDKIANCGEIAKLVALNLVRLNLKQNIEVLRFSNGDHGFTVLGRNPQSNLNDVSTWGENAVIIDAWSGRIYPASQLINQLKDYERYETTVDCSDKYPHKKFNLTFFYEPKYHKMSSVDCLPSVWGLCQDRSKDLSHFEKSEIDEMNADNKTIQGLKMSP